MTDSNQRRATIKSRAVWRLAEFLEKPAADPPEPPLLALIADSRVGDGPRDVKFSIGNALSRFPFSDADVIHAAKPSSRVIADCVQQPPGQW